MYNFSATYRVAVDDYFLRFLATECVVVDIIQVPRRHARWRCCHAVAPRSFTGGAAPGVRVCRCLCADAARESLAAGPRSDAAATIAGCAWPSPQRAYASAIQVSGVVAVERDACQSMHHCGCCVVVTRDGKTVGSIRLEVRLAVPVSELWDVFVQDHPEEKVGACNDIATMPRCAR